MNTTRSITLLYLEDHEVFARGVKDLMLSEYEVMWVTHITEAKAQWIAAPCPFDVVLCDYDLPQGKGTEFVLWLRDQGERVPIIAVSSHEDGNEVLMSAGANAICSKMDIAQIAAHIRRVVSDME